MEIELEKVLLSLQPGLVLDIGSGDAPYREVIQANRYITMDVTDEYGANIVSDIHQIGCATNIFDIVLATGVLEHCHDPKQAILVIYRILKNKGVCVLTTRFIQSYHPTPGDYYRFSWGLCWRPLQGFFRSKDCPSWEYNPMHMGIIDMPRVGEIS